MFTGLVEEVGKVLERAGGRLVVAADRVLEASDVGASVAVNGACLTVVERTAARLRFDVGPETLARTALADLAAGDGVNLERPLRLGGLVGGHLVQGHVDGTGVVLRVAQHADARLLDIRVPREVAAVSVPLGSITVDGVSLTVNAVPAPDVIQVSLIPFTLQETTLGERVPGDEVHLEGDTIGKYVRALLEAHRA